MLQAVIIAIPNAHPRQNFFLQKMLSKEIFFFTFQNIQLEDKFILVHTFFLIHALFLFPF